MLSPRAGPRPWRVPNRSEVHFSRTRRDSLIQSKYGNMTDIESSQQDKGSGGYRDVQKNGENAEAASPSPNPGHSTESPGSRWPMQPEEYERYSRQMIVPGVGLQGWFVSTRAKTSLKANVGQVSYISVPPRSLS